MRGRLTAAYQSRRKGTHGKGGMPGPEANPDFQHGINAHGKGGDDGKRQHK